MHTSYFAERDLVRWDGRDYHPRLLQPELARWPEALEFTGDLFAYLAASPPGRSRGFKETLLFEKLPWLARVAPALRVIHLVRDPRAVVTSLLRLNFDRLWNYRHNLERYLRRYDDLPFTVELGTELDQCISSWQVRHFEARRHLDEFAHVRIRLEDLLDAPGPTLGRVMTLLGARVEDRQLDWVRRSQQDTRGGPYSTYRRREDVVCAWRRQLSGSDRARIEDRLAREMDELGYVDR
jgi:hypothetical protein